MNADKSSGQHAGSKKTIYQVLSKISGSTEITGDASTKRLGDIKLWHENQEIFVEVKRDQLAQVRAIACKVIIFHLTRKDQWFVLSPDDVMKLAHSRGRGQHTEIPYECCHLGQLTKELREKYLVSGDLKETVIKAYLQGESSGIKKVGENMMARIFKCKKECKKML